MHDDLKVCQKLSTLRASITDVKGRLFQRTKRAKKLILGMVSCAAEPSVCTLANQILDSTTKTYVRKQGFFGTLVRSLLTYVANPLAQGLFKVIGQVQSNQHLSMRTWLCRRSNLGLRN